MCRGSGWSCPSITRGYLCDTAERRRRWRDEGGSCRSLSDSQSTLAFQQARMVREFVVRERVKEKGSFSSSCSLLAVLLLAYARSTKLAGVVDNTWITCIALAMAVLSYTSRLSDRTTTKEARVFVFAWGVQIETASVATSSRSSRKQQGSTQPTFLLRQDIIDCVVSEAILANRVVNIILFRVRNHSIDGHLNAGPTTTALDSLSNQDDIQSSALRGSFTVRLVPAFPGLTELQYVDCLHICRDIMNALSLKQ